MNVKNYMKLFDKKILKDFSIKVKTWDYLNGFRNWNHDDPEIQKAKVINVVVYKRYDEIEIQAKIIQ